jgi:hypothetical protein
MASPNEPGNGRPPRPGSVPDPPTAGPFTAVGPTETFGTTGTNFACAANRRSGVDRDAT